MLKLAKIIPAGSLILGLTTLTSYVLGLIRDRVFAQTFGTSQALDAYNAAFLLPDFLFNFLIASGISAAFVPIFTEIFYSNKKKAHQYANSIITGATIITTSAAVILFIFADSVSSILTPGFDYNGHKYVTQITRVLAISPILFGISNTLGAMLIAKRRFLFYGLSPILYNLGIIGGTIFLSPKLGPVGIAIGTVFGAFLHMTIRYIDSFISGFSLKFNFNFQTFEIKKTIQLMLPKMFGHPVELAMFWGFTIIASTLGIGAIVVMSFARNFQSVPVSLIGITFSTTTFPIMAKAISDHSQEEFKKTLRNSFWLIFSGSMLAAIAIFLIKEPLIRTVLGGGNFTEEAIIKTATTLGMFTLAIPTESLVHLLTRAFYATKNTLMPVVASIFSLVIAVSGGYLLSSSIGIIAIPFSFFIASFVELILLMFLISYRLKQLPWTSKVEIELVDPHQPQ